MEDEISNEGEIVEYIDSQDEEDLDTSEDRPIMLLLRRLIRNKQNTVMTNTQIIDILQTEFNICVASSHALEIDIYVKIIKKYLKDWPQWEELERISMKLRKLKDFEALSQVLSHKYKNLKEYLGVMLEAAKPLATDAVKSLTPEDGTLEDNIDTDDVMMEIQCTKEQLNHLFFRRPRLDLNNTVFNMATIPPSRICLKKFTFEEILNGWCINLNINLQNFVFTREVQYKLKHVLINKVRNENITYTCLPTFLQKQQPEHQAKKAKNYSRDTIIKQFTDILDECSAQSYELYAEVQSIFDILISELKVMFDKDTYYKVPAKYRKYANQYKYVRYLYAENEENDDPRYDLQLEETVSPSYCYSIGKINKIEKPIPPISEWVKLECDFCKIKLPVITTSLKEVLETHFNDVHQNEVDWQCTYCKKKFNIDFLLNNKWFHEC